MHKLTPWANGETYFSNPSELPCRLLFQFVTMTKSGGKIWNKSCGESLETNVNVNLWVSLSLRHASTEKYAGLLRNHLKARDSRLNSVHCSRYKRKRNSEEQGSSCRGIHESAALMYSCLVYGAGAGSTSMSCLQAKHCTKAHVLAYILLYPDLRVRE